MAWKILGQCSSCSYVQVNTNIPCEGCGATITNHGIGREFGADTWELMSSRFETPPNQTSKVVMVNSSGIQIAQYDLVISNGISSLVPHI